MTLFAIVGITSTNTTFFIAHCFMYKEKDDNYQWALLKLKMLFEAHELPSIFVTDKKSAYINAIGKIFLDARRMLSLFHIFKNVEQRYKPLFE